MLMTIFLLFPVSLSGLTLAAPDRLLTLDSGKLTVIYLYFKRLISK